MSLRLLLTQGWLVFLSFIIINSDSLCSTGARELLAEDSSFVEARLVETERRVVSRGHL